MNVILDRHHWHQRYFLKWTLWVPVWTDDWRKAKQYEGTDAALDLTRLREAGRPGKLVSIRQLEKEGE